MHIIIKEIGGIKICHRTIENTYYFEDEIENWIFEDKSLQLVEDVADSYSRLY